MKHKSDNPIVAKIEKTINEFVILSDKAYSLPLTLWVLMTHCWPSFDVLPGLIITAFVKQSGKTRLMEILMSLSANGRSYGTDSAASMYNDCEAIHPAMFLDEAEKLNQESHPAREFLNKGYRRGQMITKYIGGEVKTFDTFCPKCFVLIGDVYDTLRDRSIIVACRRKLPTEKVRPMIFQLWKAESEELRGEIHAEVEANVGEIEKTYQEMVGTLDFFTNDRDAEIWTPLFAICRVLCPSRYQELVSSAVDIATEKTIERRSFKELVATEEDKAEKETYGARLLLDMIALTDGKKFVASSALPELLKGIATAPWRKFRGRGITANDIGDLLSGFANMDHNNADGYAAASCVVRIAADKPKRGKSGGIKRSDIIGDVPKSGTVRGYRRDDLIEAARKAGLRL